MHGTPWYMYNNSALILDWNSTKLYHMFGREPDFKTDVHNWVSLLPEKRGPNNCLYLGGFTRLKCEYLRIKTSYWKKENKYLNYEGSSRPIFVLKIWWNVAHNRLRVGLLVSFDSSCASFHKKMIWLRITVTCWRCANCWVFLTLIICNGNYKLHFLS